MAIDRIMNLKESTIRGGSARLVAQGTNFALRMGSIMVLSRLLGAERLWDARNGYRFYRSPKLFRDFGLSAASCSEGDVNSGSGLNVVLDQCLVGADPDNYCCPFSRRWSRSSIASRGFSG